MSRSRHCFSAVPPVHAISAQQGAPKHTHLLFHGTPAATFRPATFKLRSDQHLPRLFRFALRESTVARFFPHPNSLHPVTSQHPHIFPDALPNRLPDPPTERALCNARAMFADIASYPTHSEARALASLVTPDSASTAPDILNEIISICQAPHVHDFLFTEEPIQLPHLTNPNLSRIVTTASITTTHIESSPLPTSDLSMQDNGSFFVLSAFSINSTTLGFGVHQHHYTPAAVWDERSSPMHLVSESRFYKDDAAGTFLFVFDQPDRALIRMEYYSHLLSPSSQKHASIVCCRYTLRSALQHSTLSISNFRNALRRMMTAYETRDCPRCKSPHHICTCRFQLARPRHPFDHDTFMSNLNFRAGTFEGIANATVYDGLRSRTVPLGSRCTIQRGADPGVVEWLRDWAIAKHKRFADPRESAMLAGNHQENAVLDISNANAIGHWEKGMVQDSQNGAGGGADWLDGLVLDTKQEDVVTSAKKHQRSNTSSQKITDTTSATTTERECRNDNKDSASSAEGAVSSSVALIAGQKSETKGDLVSELKAQLRRERNRASAQRANLRKKAMNDALKRELKNSLERAGELRSREMFLRQENMRLRKLLAES